MKSLRTRNEAQSADTESLRTRIEAQSADTESLRTRTEAQSADTESLRTRMCAQSLKAVDMIHMTVAEIGAASMNIVAQEHGLQYTPTFRK